MRVLTENEKEWVRLHCRKDILYNMLPQYNPYLYTEPEELGEWE